MVCADAWSAYSRPNYRTQAGEEHTPNIFERLHATCLKVERSRTAAARSRQQTSKDQHRITPPRLKDRDGSSRRHRRTDGFPELSRHPPKSELSETSAVRSHRSRSSATSNHHGDEGQQASLAAGKDRPVGSAARAIPFLQQSSPPVRADSQISKQQPIDSMEEELLSGANAVAQEPILGSSWCGSVSHPQLLAVLAERAGVRNEQLQHAQLTFTLHKRDTQPQASVQRHEDTKSASLSYFDNYADEFDKEGGVLVSLSTLVRFHRRAMHDPGQKHGHKLRARTSTLRVRHPLNDDIRSVP